MDNRIQPGLRMPPKLHRKISRYCHDKGIALNKLVCDAIEFWWKKQVPVDVRTFYAQEPPGSRAPKTKIKKRH